MKNPFPGMNPWLEAFWQDVHAKVLVYACDQLNGELPPRLRARVDERLSIGAEEEKARTYLPDVAVLESWDRPTKPVLGQHGLGAVVAEPIVVSSGQEIVRHLEIVDSRSHIITAIELLSPSNKANGEAGLLWKRKRFDYLRVGISLVEIDLLRGGCWTLPDRSLLKPVPTERVWHYACVSRAPWVGEHEFYVLPLRQRLPAIRIPLRQSDPDAALDLQVLIDQCYERGRYAEEVDYAAPPQPTLPAEEAAWAKEVISGVTR